MRLARAGTHLAGSVPLADLHRLTAAVLEASGDANAEFYFGIDDRGFAVMSGQVRATVHMQCQRCLSAMTVELNSDVRIGLVRKLAEESQLPDDFEALLVEGDEPLMLNDFIEEELLLALPIVARHEEDGQCVIKEQYQAKEEKVERPNPFAVLASLKKNH